MAVPGITTEVSGRVAGQPEAVCNFFRELDVTTILTGRGPLPAVRSVENAGGHWNAPGQQRHLQLSDGSSLRERLTHVDTPHGFAYELDEITGPLRHLVRRFSGHWSFETDSTSEESTHASWQYVFEPRSWITWLPSALIVHVLWTPYLRSALARASQQARARLPS